MEEEDEEEYEPIPEPDARGELHGEALAQGERAAATRPGVNGRLEDDSERIIERGRVRDNPNLPESRMSDEQFEGEPTGTGQWASGVQESLSVFAPDAEEESEHEPDWQEFPWEQPQNEESDEQDENIPPQPTRRAVIRHDEEDDHLLPLPTTSNCAGPSGWRPSEPSTQQPHRLWMDSNETFDYDEEKVGASSAAFYAERREKHRVNHRTARQFIDSMATMEGESKSNWEEDEDDASSTASDDSFIVGDDIFD